MIEKYVLMNKLHDEASHFAAHYLSEKAMSNCTLSREFNLAWEVETSHEVLTGIVHDDKSVDFVSAQFLDSGVQ